MHFQRLRLSGFKSFVEPTEFRIEPGLTGVVGPNGCGKSNLLEALRWVMGATSAKAMRGEGMDDVIFGGADGRASRNHAEVLLQIDNSDRSAPAQFNDHPVLEVTRRIDRGSGSTYRVNGVETRARDVQLLFADASTGANSPSLVRQGQISELIAAKPSNRRRILEEAAGVSGLHTRRHDADLRLRAAEQNLERLGDVFDELEGALARLKRDARQAESYRRVAAEIRFLKGAALFARWREADEARAAAQEALVSCERDVETTARQAASAAAQAIDAFEAVKPLRDEAAIAATLIQRLLIERDRMEREDARTKDEVKRLQAARARMAQDQAREEQMAQDAATTLGRLAEEMDALDSALRSAPARVPALEAAVAAAQTHRITADEAVEGLAAGAAVEAARRQDAAQALHQAQARRRAARARVEECQARCKRTAAALEKAQADAAALGPEQEDGLGTAAALEAAEADLAEDRAAVEAAESRRADAAADESAARETMRSAEDALRLLTSEADGLQRLQPPAGEDVYPPALDQVLPDRGFETALAAALGDELDAALDPRSPTHWAGAEAEAPRWPKGATPLSEWVKAPPALEARMALIALVDAEDGERLQKVAPIGARLVSLEGDLWRWDGFTVLADAPKPAAVRLAQKARLAELSQSIDQAEPALQKAAAAHGRAVEGLKAADAALAIARRAPEAAERAVAEARRRRDHVVVQGTRREAQRLSLQETTARLKADAMEGLAALAAAESEALAAEAALAALPQSSAQPDERPTAERLNQARVAAAEARDAEGRARAVYEQERIAREDRQKRHDRIAAEHAEWLARARAAAERIERLTSEADEAAHALMAVQDSPAQVRERLQQLITEFSQVEDRRIRAAEALAAAESTAAQADRDARTSETVAASARESRAAAQARHLGAVERTAALADQVRQALGEEPEALGARLRAEAVAIPADAQGVETHILNLERQRDALGAVNLRADEEASELSQRLQSMASERQDLTGAISRLRGGVEDLNREGRDRLQAAFGIINESFKALFETLFEGGQAELRLVESPDPLEAGLEIFACPPGKRLAAMSLMSGGEQALTATALIFAVFLANPSPICVLDEVDAPLDDANVDRFCKLLDEMRRRTQTRFIAITHHPVTMSRVDRLYGVTMAQRGVSQLVSVDLRQAEALAAE